VIGKDLCVCSLYMHFSECFQSVQTQNPDLQTQNPVYGELAAVAKVDHNKDGVMAGRKEDLKHLRDFTRSAFDFFLIKAMSRWPEPCVSFRERRWDPQCLWLGGVEQLCRAAAGDRAALPQPLCKRHAKPAVFSLPPYIISSRKNPTGGIVLAIWAV
jgi:hypothetical protein